MKLKRLKKSEKGYDQGVCAASRCKMEAKVYHIFGGEGRLPLCAKHGEQHLTEPKEGMLMPAAGVQTTLATEASDAGDILTMVKEFEIVEQADYDFANEALGDAKSAWKALEERKKAATGPLNAALKEIRSWFKPAQSFYAEAESLLKAKLVEAHKKAAEEQDKALRAVQEAHAQGDTQAVREALVRSESAEIQQAGNVTLLSRWDFEIIDASKLPRTYLCPDLNAIKGVVKSLGPKAEIPGVRVFETTSVMRRGA